MKTIIALTLALTGCTAATSNQITAQTNSTFTTTQAEHYTCEAPAALICREVLGSRVSNREQDCVCQP